ncbi:MAG: cytochrome-c peroxidase [Proteobacteria bacterium]|nr:cytochrome-c peroxidase [Pseudomonadota bacterium]
MTASLCGDRIEGLFVPLDAVDSDARDLLAGITKVEQTRPGTENRNSSRMALYILEMRILRRLVLVLLLSAVLLASVLCLSADPAEGESREQLLVPLPQTAPAPKDNPMTPEKVALGKQLFFDPRLSGDNSMSCATCHLPEKAFGDGLPRAKGHDGKILGRNTPSLLNVSFFEGYDWDGRARSLEEQALGPIQSPDEMNQDLAELERELNAIPGYVQQFQKVFGANVNRDGIAKSLAAFQRTLVTQPSPFDRYLRGEKEALSAEAKRGLELFVGDADCVRCHRGPLLSDGKFYRLGLSSKDDGRMFVTGKKEDKGRFRTPSLRNISETGPYMHNGSRKTLSEVVEFYYRGIPPEAADGLPVDVKPLLALTFTEIPAVVAFLESLTGEPPEISAPKLP